MKGGRRGGRLCAAGQRFVVDHSDRGHGGIHSGPNPGGLPAIDAEEPRFERAMGDLGESLLD